MERWHKITLWTSLVSALAILLDSLVLEHLFISVKKFIIGNTKSDKSSLKILHLTDLHFRNMVGLKFKVLLRKIEKISPDIIFISGDSIDQQGRIEPLEKFLRLLDSQIPKVAILGNHEYAAHINLNKLKEAYEKTNCDLLVNQTVKFIIKGHPIVVTGLDDLLEGNENFHKAVTGVGYEDHHFVLIHSPKHQEVIKPQIEEINKGREDDKKLNIYGFFAGHNHGGQVKLLNLVPHLPPESGGYIEGWYNNEKPYLYLSRGFGTSVIPVRFWSRSEITIFEYKI